MIVITHIHKIISPVSHKKTLFVAALLCSAIFAANLPSDATAAWSPMTFNQLATHPYAGQSGYKYGNSVMPAGRTLADMGVTRDGKLIAGYGDWDGNSDSNGVPEGRVGIVPYNISSNTWGTIIYTGTEAMETIRSINGSLYVPSTDPSAYGQGGYATNNRGSWAVHKPVPAAIHVFDVASLGQHDLWLFGSQGIGNGNGAATAWRTTDGGSTWNEVKRDESMPQNAGYGFERYYWGAALKGKVYMHATSAVPYPPMRVYDQATDSWSDSDVNLGCWDNARTIVVFDGTLLCQGLSGRMVQFDGKNVSTKVFPGYWLTDFYIDGSYLYALDSNGSILRTSSARGMWTRLGQLPITTAAARSIAVYRNYVYIGDDAGNIWKSNIPAPNDNPIFPLTR